MLELASFRTLTFSTLTLAAMLATGTAQAEPPSTPAAPAVTATMAPAAPPPVYQAPLGYANPEDPPDVEYPPEMRMRSSGMVAGGTLLLSFGLVGLIAGSAMISAHEPTGNQNDSNCFTQIECEFLQQNPPSAVLKPGFRTAGIATLVGSAVAMGAGIPLLMIGAKKVPVLDDDGARAAKLLPTLRVGAASATLTWQF
jgi:hypothetical protein